VRMYLVILQSNILVHTLFQVEVTTVTSVHFRKKFDENRKTLPFSSLVSTGVKGEIRVFSNLLILC